ncbi:MAG: FAD-binding protein [Deltaproteobacteria bacterium]|nr:FAD-binding protein [Deltaproteobacteria bacterium]
MSKTKNGQLREWPYPVAYEKENEINADILILGGGIAGCFAAITASGKGLKVVMAEKGTTVRSGSAGSGIDHWRSAATNPCSKVSPEELAEALVLNHGGYGNGINNYIACREGYDTFLELEKMGVKVRDSEDEFIGAEFRDEETKLLFSYDYEAKASLRIWGTRIKPALYNECKRLGVEIYERVMATSLLTEGGKQGERVVGATGVNVHTGEFYTFKAKATVLALSRPERLWISSTELIGVSGSQFYPFINAGDGHAMAWRAGAEFSMMEKAHAGGGSFAYPPYGVGNARNTWFPCSIVDANGKEVPWIDKDGRLLEAVDERCRTAPGQKLFIMGGGPHTGNVQQELMMPRLAMERGEFTPPFYADLPSMPEDERRVLFGLMIGQEGKTRIPVYHNLTRQGFDPDQDMLQCYEGSWSGIGPPQWLSLGAFHAGGLVTNWDLMTSLEGLFAAGDQLLSGMGAPHACSTGRYAGRKAAEYVHNNDEPVINHSQVMAEKTRVYAPIRCKNGIDWKELEAGIARVMQDYCGPVKNKHLLKLGLKWFDEIKEKEAAELSARNPHELTRALEVLTILTVGEMVIHACMARKASSALLNFKRSDYPENDPPDWHKWITTKLVDGNVQISELPLNFWGELKENYDAQCGLM